MQKLQSLNTTLDIYTKTDKETAVKFINGFNQWLKTNFNEDIAKSNLVEANNDSIMVNLDSTLFVNYCYGILVYVDLLDPKIFDLCNKIDVADTVLGIKIYR